MLSTCCSTTPFDRAAKNKGDDHANSRLDYLWVNRRRCGQALDAGQGSGRLHHNDSAGNRRVVDWWVCGWPVGVQGWLVHEFCPCGRGSDVVAVGVSAGET